MADLLPLFLNLTGRTVLLVGGGPVAASKLGQLVAAGASVRASALVGSHATRYRVSAEGAKPIAGR